jgi:tRNA dimethylallyltransferase
MARERNGIVINADAMQVYDTLQVITARPSAADMALAEHRLYGEVSAQTRFSTGQWLDGVRAILTAAEPERVLIFVGGTGLYFDALLNGFADIPEISTAVTLEVQQEIQMLDAAQRLELLAREDPATAAKLGVADPQRLVRALAVKRSTGRMLSSFHLQQPGGLLTDFRLEKLVLDPDRDILRQRIATRFQQMFEGGAIAEVEELLALDLDPSARSAAGWRAGSAARRQSSGR